MILKLFIASILFATPLSARNIPESKDTFIKKLLNKMTIDEKIGQITQVDREFIRKDGDLGEYFIGSVLSGGGSVPNENTVESFAKMYDHLQKQALKTRLRIPIIYGVDAVHGNNNVVGSTIFPHNIGLGAAADPELTEKVAAAAAEEVRASGVNWTFAPCIAVPQDLHWGRTYEGFSSNPELVSELGAAAVKGFQDMGIAACAKHFVGDGSTKNGTDRGNSLIDEKTLREIHLKPYKAAIDAGVKTVMASYSSWNGVKMHENKYLITDVLKGELGFKGFVVSDYHGVKLISDDYPKNIESAINAGVDMVMVPDDYVGFINIVKRLVSEGKIKIERLDDAVYRILGVKYDLGLFKKPFSDKKYLKTVYSKEHRAIARRAVRESAVLLKNNGIIPLKKDAVSVVVTGSKANNLGVQCGGWTVGWQGYEGQVAWGENILRAVKKAVSKNTSVNFVTKYSYPGKEFELSADFAIVVTGEKPYAEILGDSKDKEAELPKDDIQVISKMKKRKIPVVVVLLSGRPMIIDDVLKDADAFIAAWLPGSEGEGVTDVLFGDYKFKGKLPRPWPSKKSGRDLFEYGFGLR